MTPSACSGGRNQSKSQFKEECTALLSVAKAWVVAGCWLVGDEEGLGRRSREEARDAEGDTSCWRGGRGEGRRVKAATKT